MNRSVAGALATGALLSAFAVAPRTSVPVAAPTKERSGAASDLPRRESAAGAGAAEPDTRGKTDFRDQARGDYAASLQQLFQNVCSAGSRGPHSASGAKEALGSRLPPEAWARELWQPCNSEPQRLVVALVPDPVHTRLALSFDRMMEVIQQASQDQGFQFLKAVLPWEPRAHPESDRIANRLRADDYADAQHELPGVLAFRCAADMPCARGGSRHLFVLLVGESPTSGVAVQQFRTAVSWFRQAAARDAAPALRILGPAFSGSLDSLARLLRDPQEAGFGLSLVFSGTVTSRRAGEVFQAALPSVTFLPFQESDEEAIERFKRFVGVDQGHDDGQSSEEDPIAILSEDETAYGDMSPGPSKLSGFLLHFPREISRLRAAYQGIDVAGVTSGAQSGPRTVLPPNLEISGVDDDTIAPFSKQSPLSQEAVLLGIVSELRKHTAQYILVRATDPMDLLFLSRYIATAYPRGRIVTLGADLLFRREVEDSQLHGILALSTYSLAPSSNHGYRPDPQGRIERQFPSSNEIGTYNALSSLLDVREAPLPACEGRRILPQDIPLQQYGWREAWIDARRKKTECAVWRYNSPPIHLLALGHDEYWPIAHLGPGQDPGSSWLPVAADVQPSRRLLTVTAPISWVAAEVMALMLAICLAASLWFSSLGSPSQFCASLAPATANHLAAVIAFSLCVAASMVALLVIPVLEGGGWPIHLRGLLLSTLFAAALAILIAAADLFDRLTRRKQGAQIPLLSFLVAGAGGIGILACILWFAWPPLRPSLDGVWRFQVLRSLQLTSGLSPVLPLLLLLAAWMWWAFQASAGMALLDGRRPRLPIGVSTGLQYISERAADSEVKTYVVDDLLDALRPGVASLGDLLRRCALPSVLSALALAVLWGSAQWSPRCMGMSVETMGFDRVLILLFWLVLAGIVGTTLRIWAIWVYTRRLLTSLDSQPLRDGFRQLKGFSWKPLWRLNLLRLAQAQRILARVVEARHLAEKQLPELGDRQAETRMRNLHTRWNRIVRLPHPFGRNTRKRRNMEVELVRAYQGVQCDIARAAGRALNHLAAYWAATGGDKRRRHGELSQQDATARACERFVCLVYVSFILVVLVRLRTLIFAAGGMYVLVALAMTTYPFQPRAAIALLLGLLLVCLVAVVTVVLAQLHRDTTLSGLTDTKPGELGGDFWFRATSFTAVSVFTFLVSQFPQINRFFYAWFEPALRALNK